MSTDNVDSSKKFTCLSFCTGYGGIELGLRRVIPTLRTIAYVEIEAFACANLVAKIEEGRLDAAPIWTNLKTFNARPFRDKVDIVVGGYPCQPFSVAGKRKGEADERHLWPFIRDHIQQIRPVYVFLENVAGHLRLGFDRVVRDLDELGYGVEAGLFTASEVGISMEEGTRLFILAEAACINRSILLQPRESRQADIDSGRSSKMVGQANSQRPQGMRPTEPGGGGEFASAGLAVAPQGVYQEPWEEKRYLEPGMGRTVDGFASRVDELRLLGNGVMEKQAELAIRTLLELTT